MPTPDRIEIDPDPLSPRYPREKVIEIEAIDAFPDTPLLDIKP